MPSPPFIINLINSSRSCTNAGIGLPSSFGAFSCLCSYSFFSPECWWPWLCPCECSAWECEWLWPPHSSSSASSSTVGSEMTLSSMTSSLNFSYLTPAFDSKASFFLMSSTYLAITESLSWIESLRISILFSNLWVNLCSIFLERLTGSRISHCVAF